MFGPSMGGGFGPGVIFFLIAAPRILPVKISAYSLFLTRLGDSLAVEHLAAAVLAVGHLAATVSAVGHLAAVVSVVAGSVAVRHLLSAAVPRVLVVAEVCLSSNSRKAPIQNTICDQTKRRSIRFTSVAGTSRSVSMSTRTGPDGRTYRVTKTTVRGPDGRVQTSEVHPNPNPNLNLKLTLLYIVYELCYASMHVKTRNLLGCLILYTNVFADIGCIGKPGLIIKWSRVIAKIFTSLKNNFNDTV